MKRAAIVVLAVATTLAVSAPAHGGGGGSWGGLSSHAPHWAKSMNVSVRDDSGRPIRFLVSLTWNNGHFRGSYNSCNDKPLTIPVPSGGADVAVGVHVAAASDCTSVPTEGAVTVSYLDARRRVRHSETMRYNGPTGFDIP